MKEGSDKSVKIYAKAMMFDHIQRYGSLSSDVGSVLHLLEKIMAENVVQEYDSEFFHCQAASLKRRADELCEQEEVEWLLLFECSDIMELHSKMLIEDEEYMMESIVNEENRVPCPEGYLNPKKAFSVLYQKFVEEKVDLYEAFEFLLQYKEIEVYLDFYGEADDCVSMDGITFTEVHAYRPHIVDLSNSFCWERWWNITTRRNCFLCRRIRERKITLPVVLDDAAGSDELEMKIEERKIA